MIDDIVFEDSFQCLLDDVVAVSYRGEFQPKANRGFRSVLPSMSELVLRKHNRAWSRSCIREFADTEFTTNALGYGLEFAHASPSLVFDSSGVLSVEGPIPKDLASGEFKYRSAKK